jgi:hypothetical protein
VAQYWLGIGWRLAVHDGSAWSEQHGAGSCVVPINSKMVAQAWNELKFRGAKLHLVYDIDDALVLGQKRL